MKNTISVYATLNRRPSCHRTAGVATQMFIEEHTILKYVLQRKLPKGSRTRVTDKYEHEIIVHGPHNPFVRFRLPYYFIFMY